ncbi:MAG: hypothetical protein WBH14_02015 [Albidovulum sp.]
MIFFAAIVIGAFYGWNRAAKRDGNRLDKLQYAAVYAIVFAIAGLIATIIYHRLF